MIQKTTHKSLNFRRRCWSCSVISTRIQQESTSSNDDSRVKRSLVSCRPDGDARRRRFASRPRGRRAAATGRNVAYACTVDASTWCLRAELTVWTESPAACRDGANRHEGALAVARCLPVAGFFCPRTRAPWASPSWVDSSKSETGPNNEPNSQASKRPTQCIMLPFSVLFSLPR